MAERLDPGSPGNRLAAGQAFVEMEDRVAVLRNHPVGDVGVVDLGELVLRGGHVVRPGDYDDEEVEEVVGRRGHRHHQHGVDEDEIPPAEGEASPDQAEQGVDGEDEEKKDGPRRGAVDPHGRGLEHEDDVRRAQAHRDREHGPDDEPLGSEGRPGSRQRRRTVRVCGVSPARRCRCGRFPCGACSPRR